MFYLAPLLTGITVGAAAGADLALGAVHLELDLDARPVYEPSERYAPSE